MLIILVLIKTVHSCINWKLLSGAFIWNGPLFYSTAIFWPWCLTLDNILSYLYKAFPKHLVISAIHHWKVSCWAIKLMRIYAFISVNSMTRHDESCCDLYRHATGYPWLIQPFSSYLMSVELSCISLSGNFSKGLVMCKISFSSCQV
jgi:hypothetical protein